MALYREHEIAPPALVLGLAPHRLRTMRRKSSRLPARDQWRAEARLLERIDRALFRLRERGRRSVFIVDAKCGDGRFLILVARRARALGFVAIDAHGFDAAPEAIAAARAATRAVRDPAIGLAFDVCGHGAPIPLGDDEADLVIEPVGAGTPFDLARLIGRDGEMIRR